MNDGCYTLAPKGWPHPITLEVRRWHADVNITQLCFGAGWQKPSPEAVALDHRIRQIIADLEKDKDFAAFRQWHGNIVLYSPHSEMIEVDDVFVEYCERYTEATFPHLASFKSWCYASNDRGWTILLHQKVTTT